MNTSKAKLQIIVETDLKNNFEKAVRPLDLSNAVRMLMSEVANGRVRLGVRSYDDQEILDDETERSIEQSMKDYQKGNYVTLRTKKDIENYFREIEEKANE